MDARRLIRIGLVSVVVIAVLAAAVLSLLHGDRYRTRIEDLAAAHLDASLRIHGPLTLSLLPRPAVVAQDVVLREESGTEIGRADRIRIELSWHSLIRRQPAVARLTLQAPQVSLTRARDGQLNVRLRNAATTHAQAPSPARQITLGRLDIEDGQFTFTQQTADASHALKLEDVSLTARDLRLAADDQPLIRRLAAEGELHAARLHLGAVTIQEAQATLVFSDGQASLRDLHGELFEGQLSGELNIAQAEAPLQLDAAIALKSLSLQAFLRHIFPEINAGGRLDFTAELASKSRASGDWLQQLDGLLELRGEQLQLQGLDLDAELARYRDTQRFNLVDLGALVFAGPAGIAATKGAGFAQLMNRSGGETSVRELVSRWRIRQGVARAEDVALATAHNRLVLLGQLDLQGRRFDDTEVAVVDRNGCAVIRQGISGTFSQPQVESVNYVRALLGAPLDLLRQGLSLIDMDQPCRPVYHGRIAAP